MRRKPIERKLILGTYRADRDGPIASAVKADGEPLKPDALKGEPARIWRRLVPLLHKQGTAKEIDSEELVAMCEWLALYHKAMRHLKRKSPGEKDYIKALIACSMPWKQFDRIASKFGMTPSDRATLKVEPPVHEDDPMEKFLNGRRA